MARLTPAWTDRHRAAACGLLAAALSGGLALLASSPDDLLSLLVPAAPGRLEAYPVSTEVNNVRNNGADLLEPLAADSLATEPSDPA